MEIPNDVVIYIISFLIPENICKLDKEIANYFIASKDINSFISNRLCSKSNFLTLNNIDFWCSKHNPSEHYVVKKIIDREIGLNKINDITCTYGFNCYTFHYKSVQKISRCLFNKIFNNTFYSIIASCCEGKGIIFKKDIKYI